MTDLEASPVLSESHDSLETRNTPEVAEKIILFFVCKFDKIMNKSKKTLILNNLKEAADA